MYTLLEKGHTISADDIQGNFNHVGQGDLIPRGGNLLEPTTSVYDLGSDTYRFNQGYVNTINLGSGTVNNCMNMIAEVNVTATTMAISISGLNGSVDQIYEINFEFYAYATSASILFINSDGTFNNYGYQVLISEGSSIGSFRYTSSGAIWLGELGYDTTTARYSKGNIIIYADNNIKLILNKVEFNIGGTYIGDMSLYGQVWNNTDTITTLSFGYFFNPGTHIEIWAKR